MEIGGVFGNTEWTYYSSPFFQLSPMPVDTTALWFFGDFNDAIGLAWFDDVGLNNNNVVPEPATMLLLGSGLIGLAGYGRRKFRGK